MYQLSFNETHSLLRKAESGMGYQVVDAQTMDYRTRRGVVFNAELLTFDEDEHSDRLKLSKSYTEALRSAKNTAGQFRSLVVVPDSRTTVLSKRNTSRPSTGEQKAMEVERALQDASVTKEGDVFYRFSAFENDRRVTPEKRLLPGTYATTKEDGDKVKTGKEAVERYALPNPGPASYRFTIKPNRRRRRAKRSGAGLASAQTGTGDGKRGNMAQPRPVRRTARKRFGATPEGMSPLSLHPAMLDQWSKG